MRQSKAALVVIAVLMAAVSVSVFARGHSGGRGGGHGGHASSGGAGHGGHASSGARASSGHVGSRPSFAGHVGSRPAFVGHARVGMFIGAPLFAPLFYPAPDVYYSPAPVYIEQAPTPAYWYFCPESNAYYPHLQECPGGWQPVMPQPSGPGSQLPE